MEIVKLVRNNRKSLCILMGLLIFFLGMLAAYGVGVYNDSDQYITMHIHREPLYPLFLALFRTLIGEGYLTAAAAVQNILAAVSVWVLSEYITGRFGLRLWEELLVIGLQLIPHLMTRYVSALGIFLENSVMSEALCIPLFQFYLYFLLRMIYERRRRDGILALLAAFLLSLTRGQMMSTLLIWMVVALFQMLLNRQYRRLALPVVVILAVFGLRSLSTHVYNYAVTGYFMGNTYGQVNTLTNVIYACDPEDGEALEEGSLEREFFDRFYAEADAITANYKYGGNTFTSRIQHLESYHDVLKFQVLEADLSAYYFGLGEIDYYEQSSMSDEMAGIMIRGLLPECFGQWLYDYGLLCVYGFVRSIAVVHPLLNWAALLLYVLAAGLALWQGCRARHREAVWIMGVALLFICANVCATSMTIMCLSRYMIYGFSLFYIALFLLGREWLQDVRKKAAGA
ncbi:MAG: hypothetical protein LUI12_11160 [Clostridiales bacterium]|nr:hypothetical protein [Clostridiales bacterium]